MALTATSQKYKCMNKCHEKIMGGSLSDPYLYCFCDGDIYVCTIGLFFGHFEQYTIITPTAEVAVGS